ncbi:MAG: type II secretory pathway, component PulD [Candidatus Didemnitutus sp.]|nr:type II secretory pathway, component PulD [Candidatus Didemnitutus sp.]
MFCRLSLWVGCVAFATALPLPTLQAEDAAEAKIRLLSEALRARDDGDLTAARARLEELLRIAPNDPTVLRLLASLEQSTAKKVTVTGGTVAPADHSADREAEELARAEEQRLARLLAAAQQAMREARDLAARQDFAAALERLARARAALPENPLTAETHAALAATAADIDRAGGEVLALRAAERAQPAPVAPPAASQPAEVRAAPTPSPVAVTVAPAGESIAALVARGRSQYLAGDPSAAAQTFARTLELDPSNADARDFLRRIANQSVDGNLARAQTSAQLLNEVARAWQRPGVYREPPPGSVTDSGPSPLLEKLNQIVLPAVNFSGMELSRVVSTLSTVSEEFDPTGTAPKGVNIVLVDPTGANPAVNLTLRNLTLKRVLDFVTDSVGYQYEVQADAVVVRAGGEQTALDTQFYPVSRSTVLRMTGRGGQSSGGGSSTFDPITGTGGSAAAAAPQNVESEGQAIRNFLQLAGVSFEGTPGSTLAFDGSQLIVTQTGRNLERIRNILARYSDVRQVEIEAKFMEVQDGALEELGVNWNIGKKATQQSGASVTNYVTSNRSLLGAFTSNSSGVQGAIVRPEVQPVFNDLNGDGVPQPGEVVTQGVDGLNIPILNNAPLIPGTNNLGQAANPLATITGIVGEFNVNAVIRALSQRSGTELLSAPKLTVLSGNAATITVAQELRYPQSYGQVQSQVGTGSASGGGSAGVTITAGTPQEFTTRNIGVELKVTPTVEEDDYSISLDLNPKVTEFEGFVEYGGQSVAVSGSTTVTVPSGFYQPIFAVREVSTKVTIWDGATIVMGGLTREDTRKTNDKVPVVGNLPVLGRLFRSSGESAQKRNLLIFVTANLVSPGGSLKKQNVQGLPPGTIFQNPTIVTPAGAAGRASGAR